MFITGLKYVLAVDDDYADLQLLERRLTFIASMRREYGLDETCWHTVHCVHDGNPLTYASLLHDRGGTATIADVATVWREYLHQGLCVPTTGTHGHPTGQRALRAFASVPRLVSQVRFLVTPEDPYWNSGAYVDQLAADLRILQPLWGVPTDSLDAGPDAHRLHLVVRASDTDMPAARHVAERIMLGSGMGSARMTAAFDDPRAVTFERPPSTSNPVLPNTDLHLSPDDAMRTWFGVRTNGALFEVDAETATETAPDNHAVGRPGYVDAMHLAVIRAGWAA